ncbi:translocon gamma subunit Sss1 [Schizosaccharomyces japonicus yFS275]|uniref:Translocon gamma subunit Sss1 n=1 Tax=Schizosaccharomyces japonicus (strain yFS275 / FY16936) TaxID=402676 RepID=B6JX32_SCHJY|nr:translocon gamma subunit Sss1 [Schizosaccharomyces japonicus yFS275]EEB05933.1 translocon gamma subunit Sss1 [Schizosaccharomyces japonicus yFS275]
MAAEKSDDFSELPKTLYKEGSAFVKRCVKPNRKEFLSVSKAVAAGFILMGFIGYIIKLVHIPINNVLVGSA